MSVLLVDAGLLDLHGVDEDESEAVALCLLELVFAETNAFYRQHCLAREAISSTASRLTSSVFDAIACSQLAHEQALDSKRYEAEPSPPPEINDRHAARCVPNRSPEKAYVLSTQRTHSESRGGERMSRMSLAHKRRSPEKKDSTVLKASMVTIPQTLTLPEIIEEEDPEDRAWRIRCLKELSGETNSPTRLGATSKWTTFSRPTAIVEPRVSLEVEITDSSSPLLRQEVSSGATAVKMKSSLNTFSSISTSQQRSGSAASSVVSRRQSIRSKDPSLSSSQSVPTLGSTPRKAVQLNDSLSRRRNPTSAAHSLSHHDAISSESDPWQFELHEETPRTAALNRFKPDMMAASAATIPMAITVAAGVEMTLGDWVVKGPERRDSDHTMSRKRFELHQRLATDYLLQESMLLQSPSSPSTNSSTGSKTPISTHHKSPSPRPYEMVPPDPVPIPSLSPIAKNALVIPRNHLSQSVSTPNLRIRNPSIRKRVEASTTDPLATADELEALRHARPSTALGAVVVPTPRHKRPKSSTSKRESSAGYLREFPTPQPGTIKLNAKKIPALAEADSVRQRLAWIS